MEFKLASLITLLSQRSTVVGLLGVGAVFFGWTVNPEKLEGILTIVGFVTSTALIFLQEKTPTEAAVIAKVAAKAPEPVVVAADVTGQQ